MKPTSLLPVYSGSRYTQTGGGLFSAVKAAALPALKSVGKLAVKHGAKLGKKAVVRGAKAAADHLPSAIAGALHDRKRARAMLGSAGHKILLAAGTSTPKRSVPVSKARSHIRSLPKQRTNGAKKKRKSRKNLKIRRLKIGKDIFS